jgi:hypothetical protein
MARAVLNQAQHRFEGCYLLELDRYRHQVVEFEGSSPWGRRRDMTPSRSLIIGHEPVAEPVTLTEDFSPGADLQSAASNHRGR